jgi:hypothetical protein
MAAVTAAALTLDALTRPQLGTLHAVAATRGEGHEAPFGNATLRALERRGLVELRGSPSCSRRVRWFATLQAHDLIEADRVARGATPRHALPRVTASGHAAAAKPHRSKSRSRAPYGREAWS